MGREFILDKRKFKQLKHREVSAKRFWNRGGHNVQITLRALPNMTDCDNFICKTFSAIQITKPEAKELARFLNEWVAGREPEGC